MENTKHEILTPINPMLAVYAGRGEEAYNEILERHNGVTLAELKYDGYRMQLHKKGDAVKGFTRHLNEVPLDIYPELSSSIQKLPDCVLDCELNGGIGHAGYKAVARRFRLKPQDMNNYMEKVDMNKKLELRVFDVINYEGRWLMELPISERRKYTEKIKTPKINPGKQWKISDSKSLEDLFEGLTGKKNEGLVCKNPSSLYIPGDESGEWLKLKRFETLDLVVLGVYMKDEQITQLLCGSYNTDTRCFETLAKVNATRIYSTIAAQLNEKFQIQKPESVILSPNAKSEDLPQRYIEPMSSIVMEIKAMNINYGRNWHSCGLKDGKSYSLRIAWTMQIREDKKPMQATSTNKIGDLYKLQEEN